MQRVSILLVVLGACYPDLADDDSGGDPSCPANLTCSTDVTLDFIGEAIAGQPIASGPLTTAVGGTQDITLEYDKLENGHLAPFDLAYTADNNGGPGVVIDNTVGAKVTVHGIAPNANYLRVFDARNGELFGQVILVAAEIDSIALLPGDPELVPAGSSIAFASGDTRIGVLLGASSGNRLVDSSMMLEMDGASRAEWDTVLLAGAMAGTHSLVVTAGDRSPTTLDVVIVDGADAIDAIDPPVTVPVGALSEFCFAARNAGRFIAGFSDWSVTTDNSEIDPTPQSNCFMLQGPVAGPVNLSVHAGGMTVPFTFTATAQLAP